MNYNNNSCLKKAGPYNNNNNFPLLLFGQSAIEMFHFILSLAGGKHFIKLEGMTCANYFPRAGYYLHPRETILQNLVLSFVTIISRIFSMRIGLYFFLPFFGVLDVLAYASFVAFTITIDPITSSLVLVSDDYFSS